MVYSKPQTISLILPGQEVALSTITVIVPTLNEADNVDFLLDKILGVRQSFNLKFDILFVDSASTDGTGDRVLEWQKKGPVHLLQLDENIGLAGAVIAGANYTDSTFVLVIDADLSHPPAQIPNLLEPLVEGTHDMVIGSRYVKGGSTPDWPILRKLSSRIATLPALFFCEVKDPLAGFFGVERRKLTELSDSVPGFKIGLAILAQYGTSIRVTEIPIEFRDRDYGESKMNYRVAFDYLKQLFSLAFKQGRSN